MSRIYPDYMYGSGPRDGCWWDETLALPPCPELTVERTVDVAIIGAGFTGLNAALRLAERGASVAVLEANQPGWGASGRNGGFCCLGGGMLDSATLRRQYGVSALQAYRTAEKDAITHVADLLDRYAIDADVHSAGETLLAHTPRAAGYLEQAAETVLTDYDLTATLHRAANLPALGMDGPFHGALTVPAGFALNPRKYLGGLLRSAQDHGVAVFGSSPVKGYTKTGGRWKLSTPNGSVEADVVVVATNGYSAETLPGWMRSRYLPTQSSVLVTRPISASEQAEAGWTTSQMAYDTRNLLHYFRLMPDGRFLFGMRGGLRATPAAEAASRVAVQRHFQRMFPAWREVEITNQWSGLVCLSPKSLPFAGPISEMPGWYAGFAYHGNGVAMGSFVGARLGDHIMSPDVAKLPAAIASKPGRFPLGRFRRLLMPPVYAAFAWSDR